MAGRQGRFENDIEFDIQKQRDSLPKRSSSSAPPAGGGRNYRVAVKSARAMSDFTKRFPNFSVFICFNNGLELAIFGHFRIFFDDFDAIL